MPVNHQCYSTNWLRVNTFTAYYLHPFTFLSSITSASFRSLISDIMVFSPLYYVWHTWVTLQFHWWIMPHTTTHIPTVYHPSCRHYSARWACLMTDAFSLQQINTLTVLLRHHLGSWDGRKCCFTLMASVIIDWRDERVRHDCLRQSWQFVWPL